MEISDLVKQVNTKLKEEKTSVAKIEKELGYGKDSIRQRLKRNGYTFKKEIKQFVLQDNTNNTKEVTQDNIICYKRNEDASNPVKEKTGEVKMTLDTVEQEEEIFTKEEILFIKNLYKQHKVTQVITKETTAEENLITRSIRIDKNTINTFAEYCKDNNIKQSTALKIALENFMQNS